MPQLLGIAVVGALLYGAYRLVSSEMKRIGDQLDAQKGTGRDPEAIPTLVKDPETGTYRPETRSQD